MKTLTGAIALIMTTTFVPLAQAESEKEVEGAELAAKIGTKEGKMWGFRTALAPFRSKDLLQAEKRLEKQRYPKAYIEAFRETAWNTHMKVQKMRPAIHGAFIGFHVGCKAGKNKKPAKGKELVARLGEAGFPTLFLKGVAKGYGKGHKKCSAAKDSKPSDPPTEEKVMEEMGGLRTFVEGLEAQQ